MKLVQAGSPQAWQPLTPPGVAAFATASWKRLTIVLLIFASSAGISTTTFLSSAWFPIISQATQSLPEAGYIRGGHLAWTGASPTLLANNPWLAITVDLQHDRVCRPTCDLQVEFASDSVRFLSLAGSMDVPYPRGWIIVFNEPELSAWWNAWKPFLAAGAGVATSVGLLALWAALATLYAIPARAVCSFVEHDLPYRAVWKVCLAAQMPGCLLMTFALLLYSLRAIDLVQWLFMAGAHLLLSWLYLFLSTFFLPVRDRSPRRKPNPFAGW